MPESKSYELQWNPIGFFSTKPLPTLEILSHHYASKYFQEPSGTFASSYSSEEELHRTLKYRLRLDSVKSLVHNPTNDSLLTAIDVGCGEGFFLKFLRQEGFDALGLDYSSEGVANHNPEVLDFLLPGDPYDSLDLFIQQKKKI